VLYEMLTGHGAVHRRHAGRDRDEAPVAIPEPPSALNRPEVPHDLDAS
jgi:hypothetical protein